MFIYMYVCIYIYTGTTRTTYLVGSSTTCHKRGPLPALSRYIYVCVCACVCVHVYMYVHTHTYTHTHKTHSSVVYMCVHVRTHTHTHPHTHTHTHTHLTHTHLTHTHTGRNSQKHHSDAKSAGQKDDRRSLRPSHVPCRRSLLSLY